MTPSKYSTLIIDIGDVLFSWSSATNTRIPPKLFNRILCCQHWFEYERGRITQEVCYQRVGETFSVDPQEFGNALAHAKDSLQPNGELISVIRELKAKSNGKLRVFAMSNISLPDFEALRAKPFDWSIFDEVFTSGGVGERKPHFRFYTHVIEKTGADPKGTIFIDDKFENVLQARCVGWHGIVFDSPANVISQLRNLLDDQVERGHEFLNRNAKKMHSIADNGVVIKENFAQLLILDVTGNSDLVDIVKPPRLMNFFSKDPIFTTESYPLDLDTTSLYFTVIKRDDAVVHSVMDEMLEYVNEDGIVEMYFDHNRPRVDPVVCINILTLFYTYGRGIQLRKSFEWVYQVLLHRAYVDGTRYYTAEDFLFLLTRLLGCSDSPDLLDLRPLLKERVQERIGTGGDALALAMRILTCNFVGIRDEVDLQALRLLQCEDGDWGVGWMYKYPGGIKIGNQGYTTAMAIKAIEVMAEPLSL